ncbi:AAA family ATPase [Shimia thalassica]|uniref:AAA family ATPase n=1 Tax=Shimia thalassica TaxID=1715693 RepID=UPI00249555AB|nr:AAA family ATPase [Shimia thalassica]
MHTITIHAAKGGSGRTTTVMALASGFLALGKRVMVMDCTSQACRGPKCQELSTLQTWIAAMEACRFRPPELELAECPTDERVEDALAAAATRGFDVVLIDTQAYPEDARTVALHRLI